MSLYALRNRGKSLRKTEKERAEELRERSVDTRYKESLADMKGWGETALTLGSGMGASAVGGVAGIGNLMLGQGMDTAADTVKYWQDELTMLPETEQGRENLMATADAMNAIPDLPGYAGDQTLEATGSPALAALTETGYAAGPFGPTIKTAMRASRNLPDLELHTDALALRPGSREAQRGSFSMNPVQETAEAVQDPAIKLKGRNKYVRLTRKELTEEGVPEDMITSLLSNKTGKGGKLGAAADLVRKGQPTVSRANLKAALAERAESAALIAPGLEDFVLKGNSPLEDVKRLAPEFLKDTKEYKVSREHLQDWVNDRAMYQSEPDVTPGAMAPVKEWEDWGDAHEVNLRKTPEAPVGTRADGSPIAIPGGLAGEFSLRDLFEMKGDPINPNDLDTRTHIALMEKMMRTHVRPGASDAEIFNALNFSLLSPNAPLTPNEFLAQRTRVRDMDELKRLAKMDPDDPKTEERLLKETGVGGAYRGGMGTKGTAELSNQIRLAKAIIDKPEMFRPAPGEDMKDVTLRVMNQIQGLGPKTASLGTPFLDLANGVTSAIDLHMIRLTAPRLLEETDQVGADFRKAMATRLKMSEDKLVSLFGQNATEKPTADQVDKFNKKAIDVVGGGGLPKTYRNKNTGERYGGIASHPALSPDKLLHEREKVRDFSPFYERAVSYVEESRQKTAKKLGIDPLPLFMEQWRLWDLKRERLEPHEFAHPDWVKLPKQSWGEMQKAYKHHIDAGWTNYDELPGPKDWRELYYGTADPALLGGLGGAGGLAAAAAPYLLGDEDDR